MTEEKTLVPAEEKAPMQSLADLDFQELFKFEEKKVMLGPQEAWHLKGVIRPYGKGSRRLAAAMGVEYLQPEKIFVEGEWHTNPYMVFRQGRVAGIYTVKHGIAIARDGIRYLQPNLDFIDMDSVFAQMAMNTQDKVIKKSKDAAKNCTRTVFEAMKKEWKKPGDPDWFFVPTLDQETGIAFNMSETGEAGDLIRKLMSDITGTKRNPLRKIQTATDRLVFEKLFPEAIGSYDSNSLKMMDNYGTEKKLGEDYAINVKEVQWTIEVPTERPLARSLLMELGIALRDNDAEARERKFGEIVRALGGSLPLHQLPPAPLESAEVAEGYETSEEFDKNIAPCPANMTVKEFREYWKTEFRKLNDEQKGKLLAASGFDSWDEFKLTKDNARGLIGVFMDIAGTAPKKERGIDPDDARKHMLDYYAEQDGKHGILDELLKEEGLTAETDFSLIPDQTIIKIYNKFIDQLNQ